jgi:hypothetical protein
MHFSILRRRYALGNQSLGWTAGVGRRIPLRSAESRPPLQRLGLAISARGHSLEPPQY